MGGMVPHADMPFIGLRVPSEDGEGNDNGDAHAADRAAYLNGMTPDVIMNPHAVPTRMTIAQLYESVFNMLGCNVGKDIDATPLSRMCNIDHARAALRERGFQEYGEHVMYNGRTGEQMRAKIFMGPCYLMRLKHMPADKMQARATGKIDAITHQAVSGR